MAKSTKTLTRKKSVKKQPSVQYAPIKTPPIHKRTLHTVAAPVRNLAAKVRKHQSLSPHRSFRLTNKYNVPKPETKTRSVFALFREVFGVISSHPFQLLGLTAIYVFANILLVGTVSQLDYLGLKGAVDQALGGGANGIANASTVFAATITGALSPARTELQQFMYGFLMLLFILMIMWMARHIAAEQKVTIRQTLYSAPAPLVSVTFVLVVISLQTLPAAIGAYLYTLATTQGYVDGGPVAMVFALLTFLLATLSLYWIINSIIGFVIVTLPGVYPMVALSSAKQLVLGRRFSILLRLSGLILGIVLLWAVILIPLLLVDKFTNLESLPLIPVALQLLTSVSLLISSLYLYRLYRSLL
jgi:hypothetical protein